MSLNALGSKTCNCPCHTKGINLKHLLPCCSFTYEKYKNEAGELDQEKLNQLRESRQ